MPYTQVNPLATNRALYRSKVPSGCILILKTYLLKIAFALLGKINSSQVLFRIRVLTSSFIALIYPNIYAKSLIASLQLYGILMPSFFLVGKATLSFQLILVNKSIIILIILSQIYRSIIYSIALSQLILAYLRSSDIISKRIIINIALICFIRYLLSLSSSLFLFLKKYLGSNTNSLATSIANRFSNTSSSSFSGDFG